MGAYALGAILLIACSSSSAKGSPVQPPPVSAEAATKMAITTGPPAGRSAQDEALVQLQANVDITSYLLDLTFEPSNESVSGTVTVTAASLVSSFQTLVLDLAANMNVTSVKRGSTPLTFSHAGDLLAITLDRPYGTGETFQIKVTYGGIPTPTGLGSIGWNKYPGGSSGTMVWTLSEPNSARSWWPCKDRPDDKASIETWWTVPETWVATGNGTLRSVNPRAPNRKEYRWKSTSPLSTYLVSIAATDYVKFSQTYTRIDGRTMPIDYYVFPEHLTAAQASFSNLPIMMWYFASTFGEYPFADDKYGMSIVPWGGAMEHATNTSYGSSLIDGGNLHDTVLAHELAHQWWGDSVSPQSWDEVWLNEGFATYSEALWAEFAGDAQAYANFMATHWRPSFDGPLNPPTACFNATVYNKGAWVLHMLRHVMGDQAFLGGLRDWYRTRKDSTGNSAQLQQTMEARYGASLGWFFQPWVYGEGSPSYVYGWTVAARTTGGYRTYLNIRQAQTDTGTFRMPIDIDLVTSSGSLRRTIWNDGLDQYATFETAAPVINLRLDPDSWVLKSAALPISLPDADHDGVPDRLDGCPAGFDPDQLDYDSDGSGDACDLDDDDDGRSDVIDCAPLNPAEGTPDAVSSMGVGKPSRTVARVSWDPIPLADLYDVVRGDLKDLARSYGACVSLHQQGLSYDDPLVPAPGRGVGYLVRGFDAGCGGAGTLGTDSRGHPRTSPCP